VPELPEVETIRRNLAPHTEGRVLERLEILDPRWCRPLAPAELSGGLEGRTLERLSRRGKYLVWELSGDVFLLLHLRMTGTLLLDPPGAPPHTRVWLTLGEHRLAFVDPRRFGTGELAVGPQALDAFLAARLGAEPFSAAFTGAHLHALARASRAPIKAFLLDQRKVAGVGNIYADEALFRARIHPLRPANRLTRAQCAALRDAVVASLAAGIEAKGATIDDFRDPYGVQGSFQDQFLVHLREGEPCPTCGRAVRKLRAAGRGTYVCESCQPVPRRRRGYAAASSAARVPARSASASS
jgi:formamidopyrimidine-DNA glycosylase